ncbi:Maf family protein [Litorisediminicola beolgyonensis]|uniref:Nucleoside triphosphate pyrophosphatase n=1 Tax=Litorisediminicola beolgyonensis TaxID=1173614 RepID=A0ABW3ZEP5_9RHOB
MKSALVLASQSRIRSDLLTRAGLKHRIDPARLDEESVRAALEAEAAPPRDIADALAEMKARKISERNPDALLLGCDQVLALDRRVFGKPETEADAQDHLHALSGQRHQLLSAAVICEGGKPIWRHVGVARLTMRALSDRFIETYVARNWESIRHSVGGYKLEEEGVRLFTRVEGDYFTILGLPLLELINYLTLRGDLDT